MSMTPLPVPGQAKPCDLYSYGRLPTESENRELADVNDLKGQLLTKQALKQPARNMLRDIALRRLRRNNADKAFRDCSCGRW